MNTRGASVTTTLLPTAAVVCKHAVKQHTQRERGERGDVADECVQVFDLKNY